MIPSMRCPPIESLSPDEVFWAEHDRTAGIGGVAPDPWIAWLVRLRVSRMRSMLRDLLPRGARVLDVACGQGTLTLMLAEDGFSVTGVDIQPAAISYAKKKYTGGNVRFLVANFDEWTDENRYDAVIMGEFLEHVAWPERMVARAVERLVPGGYLLVTTPNGRFLRNPLPSFSKITDRTDLERRQFQPDGDGHLFLFTQEELRNLLARAGLSLQEECLYGSYLLRLCARSGVRALSRGAVQRIDAISLGIPRLRERLALGLMTLSQRPPSS